MSLGLPYFSVCIPTYNMGQFIEECIWSILNQTEDDFEIIVSDNSSTDNTLDILAAIKDPRFRYVSSTINIGMYANLNKACKLAVGSYIKTHCADDVMSKMCLAMLKKAINQCKERPKLLVIGHTFDFEQLAKEDSIPEVKILRCGDYLNMFEEKIGAGIPHLCVDNKLFSQLGYFGKPSPSDFSRDIVTWFKLIDNVDALVLTSPLVYERPHSGQNRNKMTKVNQVAEFFDHYVWLKKNDKLNASNQRAWMDFLDKLVGDHYVSAIGSFLRTGSIEYFIRLRSFLKDAKYRKLPVRNILRRLKTR